MDSITDPAEAAQIRAKFKAMPRQEFLRLANDAGIPRSTAEKVRNGTKSLRGTFTFLKLAEALKAKEAASV